jgi:hypothetical protein
MSQDNPNSQPPASRSERGQPYQIPQPLWKVKFIQFLRRIIGILESTVDKLETLSATVLSGIIAVIAVIVLWTGSSLLASIPPQVAITPEVPAATVTTPPIEDTPPLDAIGPTLPPTAEEEETPQAIPSSMVAKGIAETPAVEPTIQPNPEPTVETPAVEIVPLTPEQVLIAAIENRVSEVSDTIEDGLVKSIQANFRNSSLVVTINNNWYGLKNSQQDKLAADMFQRARELDFSRLEIFDSQDTLVARNPVVGNEMIIFQRREIETKSKTPTAVSES